ncbi:putative oxidoreductase [wastewater metagenome]|uniref:Putative oxidoreductase n=2 Tax=unclassified sequences TaxID=12908 RepID=A0A5B8R8M4_9ZZZZ|nr:MULTISPECIES: SDR family oxidoreductase [Arhodomonas]MCS4502723.1 SDR family oxidoreductase [Arhodomonas aquaeolei]QEA03794.1 putative oxidoreductase [uncultured organism]
MELTGKMIWITGASSGIGEATAHRLSRAGATVFLSARRTDRLNALERAIREAGGTAYVLPMDITDREDTLRVGREIEDLGGASALINNAGVMPLSPLISGRIDEWERMIDVNLRGALYAIHAVLPGMADRGHGHVVNISSVAARVTFPSAAVYSATKAGLSAVSEGLRREGIRHNIRVTDIQPGAVDTDLPEGIAHDKVREAVRDNLYAPGSPILRPADIASAIHYALTQPDHVDVNEILVRPTIQDQ